MSEQYRWGKKYYVSFVFLDLICLFAANLLAAVLYRLIGDRSYQIRDYLMAVIVMAIIDVVVTFVFNTINNVLRRNITAEGL